MPDNGVINLDSKRKVWVFVGRERKRKKNLSLTCVNALLILLSLCLTCFCDVKSIVWRCLRVHLLDTGWEKWALKTSLRKNGFPEMFDLRLFFPFLVHVQRWVLCSCLKSLAGEMLIYRSIPALRQEWDSGKSRRAACSFNKPLARQCGLALETN